MTMDLRKLPNLGAIKMFEAAARLASFSRAADELNVTHSAVSHQIRALESELNTSLFKREGRRITLTPQGDIFASKIRLALGEIAAASEMLRHDTRETRLVISVLPSFAARWLMSRIGRFIEAFPDIDIEIQSTNTLTDFSRDDVDVVIRFNQGELRELFMEPLMDEVFFPVCAPGYNGNLLPSTASALLEFPLLRNDYAMWQPWFHQAGLANVPEPVRGVLYKDASQQLQAAIEGQGISLVRRSLALEALRNGQLVKLTDVEVPSPWSYWFICPPSLLQTRRVSVFRRWIHEEVEVFMRHFAPREPDA